MGLKQQARMDALAMQETAFDWAKAGIALAYNRLQLELLEKHRREMAEGFARIDALLGKDGK